MKIYHDPEKCKEMKTSKQLQAYNMPTYIVKNPSKK